MLHEYLTTDEPAPELLPHFDFFDPAHADRGPEVLAYARETCPVAHTSATGGYYIASTYECAAKVLGDTATFSSDGYVNIAGNGGIMMPPIDRDPPIHHEFRLLLNPFFHPKYIANREAKVRAIARSHIDKWVGDGECEFVSAFGMPFVADVLARVIFEEDDPELFRKAALINDRVSEGDQTAFPEFYELMTGFVDRHDGSGDGIMAAIKNGTIDGRPLTYAEQAGTAMLLFSGGLDTTKVAICDIVYEMTRRPELETELRSPGWEKSTLDELLRYSSPVTALGRVATRDVELGGQQIKQGDRVLVHYSSANRDSATFDSPDDLIWNRVRNPHVAFGLGIHRCIGIHLARLQVRVAITEILERITKLSVPAGATLTRRPGISRVFNELPIRFELRESGRAGGPSVSTRA
jgi:cytochrome P450